MILFLHLILHRFQVAGSLISADAGRVGSKVVVDASGMITSLPEVGMPEGVQLPASVHDVLIDPFHNATDNSESASVSSSVPYPVGRKKRGIRTSSIQLSVSSFAFCSS